MARPVKLRLNYRTDAAFLLRLEAAIEKDPRQSAAWKKDAALKTRQLAQLLLAADANDEKKKGG